MEVTLGREMLLCIHTTTSVLGSVAKMRHGRDAALQRSRPCQSHCWSHCCGAESLRRQSGAHAARDTGDDDREGAGRGAAAVTHCPAAGRGDRATAPPRVGRATKDWFASAASHGASHSGPSAHGAALTQRGAMFAPRMRRMLPPSAAEKLNSSAGFIAEHLSTDSSRVVAEGGDGGGTGLAVRQRPGSATLRNGSHDGAVAPPCGSSRSSGGTADRRNRIAPVAGRER